jgi:DNA-binding MarR family transcriptional regulator
MWSIVRDLHRIAQLQRRAASRSPLGPVATGLLNLAAQAPVRPKAAAEELDVLPQSITRAAAQLAAAGLVRRIGDDADGRSYWLELTDEGRAAHARFRTELLEGFGRHLAGWSAQEIDDFAQRLGGLAESLAADVPPAPSRPSVRNSWRDS